MKTTKMTRKARNPSRNLLRLRAKAANLMPDSKDKIGAYKTVFDEALRIGKLDAMLEVAPFCGINVTDNHIAVCNANALKQLDVDSFISGKQMLGEIPSHDECLMALSIYGGASAIISLQEIIKNKIPEDRLTAVEQLSVWVSR